MMTFGYTPIMSEPAPMLISNDVRIITSTGMPDHGVDARTVYVIPVSRHTRPYKVDATPKKNWLYTKYSDPHLFGIAVNGVVFDPFVNEYYLNNRDSKWHVTAKHSSLSLDKFGATIQRGEDYRYRTTTPAFFKSFHVVPTTHSPLLGYAADGFPIYGHYVYSDPKNPKSVIIDIKSNYRLKKGQRKKGPEGAYDGTYIEDYEFVKHLHSDLNKANARYGVTPEYPNGTWYYVLTDNFPYMPLRFIGTPDPSFNPDHRTLDPNRYQHPNLVPKRAFRHRL